jgi:hypothetical protein
VSATYVTHNLGQAAYAVAIGLPFPEAVTGPNGRVSFFFDDPDGQVEAACQEFRMDDPQGVLCQVSAPRLLEAWRELKKLLPRREARP